MTEFVYALHDFSPEHDDEIAFKAGERIQVVERDDLYGDGWWQGRNLAGKAGLFPQAYTSASAPAPPEVRTPTTLQSLKEEASEDAVTSEPLPVVSLAPPNDTVMAATLTDVQEAIEQLAVRRDQDTDAGRSFSFASTRDPDTETDDEPGDNADSQGWHKDARKALAERAEKENAKKLKEEEEANGFASPHRRQSPPPIAVEVSDESDADDEDEEAIRSRHHDIHPHHHKYSILKSTAPPPDSSLNDSPEPLPLQPPITLTHRTSQSSLPTPTSPSSPQELGVEVTILDSPDLTHPKPQTPTTAATARFHSSIAPPSHIASITSSLPSPATSSAGGAVQAISVPLPKSPTHMATQVNHASASPGLHTIEQLAPQTIPQSSEQSTLLADPMSSPQPSDPPAPGSIRDSLSRTHPSEWSVDQVVEWLKSRNVDEATCGKFVEHEITGDVLLELDVNILKEELNITAFGKRMRIANGILELRRPASFSSDPAGFHNGLAGGIPSQGAADWAGNGHRQDMSSNTSGDARSPGLVPSTPVSQQNRPAQLSLSSPSDGALNTKAHGGSETFTQGDAEEEVVGDRGVQSDTETAAGLAVTKRRRLLGRSTDSGSSRGDKDKDKDKDSRSRKSNETSPVVDDVTSSSAGMGLKQHMKGKRSIDGSRGAERLSFFSTTLGKSRKPPPRYSVFENDASATPPTPERSTRSIARLYLGGSTRKSGRPATPTKEVREVKVLPEVPKDPTILRKRKASIATPVTVIPKPATVTPLQPATKIILQPGQSVLDQIGRPDHAGWLRKKGVRYNTWKLRYLVLKGPHLYYLRSNSRSETKIKGYIKLQGYKVIADENANPGKYGFRIIHDTEPSHFFSSEERMVVREWMKALMKATIDRDFSRPVMSSCNIPTIPLAVAQAMNPAPRPPSPSARAATQKALRRENPNQLSSRDARVLMGLVGSENDVLPTNGDKGRLESYFALGPAEPDNTGERHIPVPPRPSRDMQNSYRGDVNRVDPIFEKELVDWANSVLPEQYRIHDLRTDLSSGLVLLRLAEIVRGKQNEPPVQDSIFAGDNLEGMFKLFDFLLDHDVKIGSVSINDVKQGRPDKTIQLLKAIKVMGEQ